MNLCNILFLVCLISAFNSFETSSTSITNKSNTDDVVMSLIKHSVCLVNQRKFRSINYLRRSKNHALLYLSFILLLNASDIETNPGPRTPKYPCQICNKAVTWKQKGVACDDCQKWYHASCMQMSTQVYMALNNITWQCCNCGMPNFSTSLFESFIIDSNDSNSFSVLDETSISPGPPLHTSSPTSKRVNTSTRANTQHLRVLNINFQSIKNKKEELANIIETSDPSIIIGTETWLNPNIYSHELFPPNYEIIRKDRSDGYGGVLLAIKNDLTTDSIHLPPEYDCELVLAKIATGNNQPLIVGAAYRPPSNDPDYLHRLCGAIGHVTKTYKGAVTWIGGDFNLPDINWQTNTIEGNHNPRQLNASFLDMIHDCALEQMVTFPTRLVNTLDLFLTNRPSLISRCTPIP
ncbi:hypothetical protein FSP39_012613 [Pinctada imbricata]|uniref:PHD-type domain-containing protein n=1 Tax=Pinctada imbricata TaxID=66713 RepID=A0AA88YC89_PINIB|nr:hypothetical protein FSP39_012613 [Pinctada imbricata]